MIRTQHIEPCHLNRIDIDVDVLNRASGKRYPQTGSTTYRAISYYVQILRSFLDMGHVACCGESRREYTQEAAGL